MRNTVLRKFSLVSFLMFLVLAVGLSLGVSGLIKSQVLNILAHVTGEYVQGLIHSQVRVETISEEHHDELARLFQQGVLGEKIIEIRVWDAQGKIIFSNDRLLIGQQFPLLTSLKKALAGEMLAEVAKPQQSKVRQGKMERKSFLKVFGPLKSTQGDILGAYEIYWDIDLLKQATSEAYYLVNIFLVIGFVVLYLVLYRYFKIASDTIEEQNVSLVTLKKRLEATRQERENTYLGTIRALLAALNARDQYTAGHSVRVADYTLQIGREMRLPDDRLKLLEEAALFHDIGKIGVPEQILNKPGRISPQEFEEIKKHPAIGAQIIGAMDKMLKHSLILRHHHERYDGAGYPDGLAGETIPLESRILAVADTFDAITSERPYHRVLSTARAREVLDECRGTQLDPLVVDAFLAVTAKEKP
ncbi:MAG: HD domain-containing protein [Firmicutes bacterium]|nr:HD domain-containing protein [Bacillota bacterium]